MQKYELEPNQSSKATFLEVGLISVGSLFSWFISRGCPLLKEAAFNI